MAESERGHTARRGGHAGVVEPARELITDVATASGLWPFTTATDRPLDGIPLGVEPETGRMICYDPLTAFRSGHQRAAQLAILAANGLGKSALAKKLTVGFAAADVPVIVPFDPKNEYTGLVRRLGGTTLRVDRCGGLNVLDPGEAIRLAMAAGAGDEVVRELVKRRDHCLATVIAINRHRPLEDWEALLLSTAVELLPVGSTIQELPGVFSREVERLARALHQSTVRTAELAEPLALSVAALAQGPIGTALGTAAAVQAWPVNQPLAVDTSAIPHGEKELSAAVIVTAWTAALSAIHLHNTMRNTVHAVLFDEIWRATREFPDLANQIGGLMRMDRHEGLISLVITHSWTDTNQPGGSNILARCAAFALGGMQNEEIEQISRAGIGLNDAELAQIKRNAAGGTANGLAVGGVGRFLLKILDGPGHTVQTVITPTERDLLATNARWDGPQG